jgi:hypothetical protein
MAGKAFATSFEKAAAENSAGRGGLIFEGQSSQPERKAGVYVFYCTSKEAVERASMGGVRFAGRVTTAWMRAGLVAARIVGESAADDHRT